MRNGIDLDEMEVVADILAGNGEMRECACNPPELENCPCIVCRAKRYSADNDTNGVWGAALEEAPE